LSLATASWGQTGTATLSGVIQDPKGAIVPDTEVTITRIETGTVATTKTNGAGVYVFTGLAPGHFHLLVQKPGFKEIAIKDIELHTQDKLEQNFSLEIGSVSESVTVDAGALNINTTDASVSTVIDRNFVENMPLNGRSFQDLLTLVPGVSQVPVSSLGGAGYSGEITVNGQRTEANYFTVDGVSADTGAPLGKVGSGAGFAGATPGETALGTTQSLVSVDDLQEFRATTSTYSAEYGRTPGGQFSFSTRSGTNLFHGAIFDYFRNDVMDANNWFNNFYQLPKGKERQNDFGGTVGGPLIIPGVYDGRNKTFFFVSYEGLRLNAPQAATEVSVPDLSLRQHAPTAIQAMLNAFPLPSPTTPEDGLNDGLGYYIESVSYPSKLDSTSVRVDHNFSDSFKVFGRYAHTPSDSTVYGAAVATTSVVGVDAWTLGATNVLNSKQSNELRFNTTSDDGSLSNISTSLGGAVPLNMGGIPGPNGPGFPTQGFFVFYVLFGGYPNLSISQQPTRQRQYNVTDTYNWTVGDHNIRFGGDWRRLSTRVTPLYEEQGYYFSEASVLSNSADYVSTTAQATSSILPIYNNTSLFVQDDWKTSRRLSLSLGLRWDIDPPPSSGSSVSPYTVTQITNLSTTELAPAGTPLWRTDWRGFAPRLGIAYLANETPGKQTVFRTGIGVFYDMGNTNATAGYGGVGISSQGSYSSVSYPLSTAELQLPPASIEPPYNARVWAFDPHLRLPYTLQYNVAIEQAFGSKQTIIINYVGSSGHRLLADFAYNPGALGNPNFTGTLYVTKNLATSNYNALQVQYKKDLSFGLQALASYTWSHSIDDASSNFYLNELLRASSDFNIRQSLQIALTYDLPTKFAQPIFAHILGGWSLDTRVQARSSQPVDIIGTSSIDPGTGESLYYQPDLVPGQPLYVYGTEYPGGRAINFNAFIAAPPGEEGDVPRNFLRGFGAVQADLAVRRDFALNERVHLQLRGEAFNLLNHANFGAIYNNLSSGPTQFGRAYNTLNASLGGLSSLYQTGGPRSLQVSAKVTF
jgi:hypothetical protein